MGQQQLLLLVLSTVIVGLAVLAGILIFQEKSRQNQADEVVNRNVTIAQEAINWRARARMYGGNQGGTYEPLGDSLGGGMAMLGLETTHPSSSHGLYPDGNTVKIIGESLVMTGIGALLCVVDYDVTESIVWMEGEPPAIEC